MPMAEQNEHNQVALLERQEKPIQDQIRESEKTLGIESEHDRLLEASLFIDKSFLSYALITGVAKKPERVFGDNAWADYLDARLFARQYGKQNLTLDFIVNLHKKLTQRSDPEISGQIRDVDARGAAYDDEDKPVTYTAEQVRAIEQNPQLSFLRVPPQDKDSTTGFIVFPHSSPIAETREEITKDLRELAEWFNNAKKQESYNPHIIAGLLQHRLISLHPFMDSNGRLTRMLMNWSLENDEETPSVIDNPTEDILTDEETWISYISEGGKKYKAFKKRQAALQEAGIDNINALFDLGVDKAFYEYIFRHLKQTLPLPTSGDKHKHEIYEDFLADFKSEIDRFQKYMRSTSTQNFSNGTQEISHGGLITSEFMEFASSTAAHVLPLELKRQFFTDTEIYRGGMADGEIDDKTICQMFLGYTGVGTGYRSLMRSHLPATSLQKVNPQEVQESMEYYNKMVASTYLQKKHPSIDNPYTNAQSSVRDLDATIREHVAGGEAIWNSPFASTSLDYRQSRSWANRFSAYYAKNARHGVLFKVQLPREGMVMTFGQKFEGLTAAGFQLEYEALVAGSLQPASIAGIEVFDRNSPHGNPGLTAKRVEEDGKVGIVVEDRRGNFVVQRTYTYNPDAARFELASEIATEIPSITPVEEPATFSPAIQTLPDFIDKHKKIYESPFKNGNIITNLIKEFSFTDYENKIIKEYKNPNYENIINIPSYLKESFSEKENKEIIPKIHSLLNEESIKKK